MKKLAVALFVLLLARAAFVGWAFRYDERCPICHQPLSLDRSR